MENKIISVNKRDLQMFLINHDTYRNKFLEDKDNDYVFFKEMTNEEVETERTKRIEIYQEEVIEKELKLLADLRKKYKQ